MCKLSISLICISLLIQTSFSGCDRSTDSSSTEQLKINTLGWVDSPWISRDGTRMYFMYSRYNFFPTFNVPPELPRLEGPDREGHIAVDVNPYWDSDIYVSTRGPGGWSEPVHLGLNDDKGDCCHVFVNGFTRIYYTKENGANGTDIYYRDLDGNGNPVGPPVLVPNVNSASNEDNPHVNDAQTAMWFTSSRPGGEGGKDIWYSSYSGGAWQTPVNLGTVINTAQDEDQFWVSEVTNHVYFNRGSQIYFSTWTGAAFTPPVHVDLGLTFVGEASLPDDESVLYFASGDSMLERIKIYSAVNNYDGTFQTPQPLD